ncbi:response regulator [Shewanella psychropiezotolerans]|uniref:Response regulator n=1 Tax=Shewanella psychropiezotolerans TaxID=2593655 RepID=A0ABX5WUV2_9GAMM|nr:MULTISPECIES: response regulator [Shewanella]MPY23250.1 response regulator [Shewanella sp. YLB-07]QDO82869.1 response regulator [Shewanella psychropiezotolerans]
MSEATLLLIEDDEFMAKQIRTLAESVGFERILQFDALPDDQSYLDADLIVTDIQLPNMVGIAHIDRIITLKGNKPIILVTGLDQMTLASTLTILKMKRVNIVAALTKPFNRKDFKQLLEAQLPK